MKNKIVIILLVISIGGILQRGVPVLSLISWPVYKTLVVSISLYYMLCIYAAKKGFRTNKCLNFYTLFLLINIFWALFSGFAQHFSYLSGLLSGLMPIYPFYYYREKGRITEEFMKYSLLFLLLVCALSFFGFGSHIEEERGIDVFTNNIGYFFIPVLNVLYFIKKDIIKYIVILVVLLFVLMSAKRGAILCTIFELFVYLYFVYFRGKKISMTKKIATLITLSIIVTFIVNNFGEETYTYQRINRTFNPEDELDVASGRDFIYARYMEAYWSSDAGQLLFGHGFNATIDIFGLHAHNDWIEILVDYGLMSAVIYLMFFIYAYLRARHIETVPYRYALYSITAALFMQTLFSMGFTSSSMAITAMLMGFLFAREPYRTLVGVSNTNIRRNK